MASVRSGQFDPFGTPSRKAAEVLHLPRAPGVPLRKTAGSPSGNGALIPSDTLGPPISSATTNGQVHPTAEHVALIASSAHSRGRNGIKSGMSSSHVFSSISTVLPFSPEISISLSKSAGL